MTNNLTLIDALNSLDGNMLLNDGAQTWDVYNLIDSLDESEKDRLVVIDQSSKGLLSIVALKDDGYMHSTALYSEVKN